MVAGIDNGKAATRQGNEDDCKYWVEASNAMGSGAGGGS